MFTYNSPIGLMIIKFDTDSQGYLLIINNERYGLYRSALAAADEVYTHTTGCYEWDSLDCEVLDAPTDIYEWERHV